MPILSGKALLTVLEISRYAALDDFIKNDIVPKLDSEYHLSDLSLKNHEEVSAKLKLNQLELEKSDEMVENTTRRRSFRK
jgi:hypothetical protein